MTEDVSRDTTEEETTAATGDAEEAANEQDKVKPVIYIGLVLTALFGLGLYDVFFKQEPNRCSMTYMYELPQYINIPMSPEVNKTFPKYKLTVYGEGRKTERLKRQQLSGIPVLFIPGNAGSVKQVRSLASVALRKAIEDFKYKTHFDYFSIDFEEEWSAVYGGTLEQQTMFVCQCLTRIMRLYRDQGVSSVKHVVLVGHSMGGVVAKAVTMYPDLLPTTDTVQLIINLATPSTPVIIMDRDTAEFYERVEQHWSGDSRPESVSLVSVGGGPRDVLVRSGLTHDPAADINTVTEAVPGAWVSADHKCIVWCKQLVISINRALFDMITPVSRQITTDKTLRDTILHYHLVHRPWGKHYDPADWRSGLTSMDKTGYWSDILPRQFTLERGNVTRDHYNMIKVVGDDVNQRMLTLDAAHMEADHWVYGCKRTELVRNSRVCVESESLSSGSMILPSRGKRKMIQLDMMEMEEAGYSHIVVNIPKNSDNSRINIDVYNPRERSVSVPVPKWINFWRQVTVVEMTSVGAVYYNISLTGLDQAWQSYVVTATPAQCRTDINLKKVHYGLARFITPWSRDVSWSLLGRPGDNVSSNSVTARLQTPKPINTTTDLPRVDLFLDPSCQYTVKIYPSIVSMMGQMVRFYSPMIIPCMAAVNILILAFQFRRIESDRWCQSSIMTLMTAVSPINVVLPSRLLAYLLTQVSASAGTDLNLIQDRGLDFGVLPIMLFFISIGLVFIISCAANAMIILCGSLAHRAVMRWATRMSPHEIVADVAVSSLSKFPSILSCLLIALSAATCGSLALCAGCFCYFLKLFKMYQDYLEGLVKRAVGLRDEDDPAILLGVNYQFTLALLWLMNTLLHFPTLITWTQNMTLGAVLTSDPSFAPAVVSSLTLAVIWQNDGQPRVEKKYFAVVAVLLQAAAVIIASFCMINLYRLTYVITAVFVIVAAHQMLSPVREPEHVDDDEEDEEEQEDNAPPPHSQSQSQEASAAESCSEAEEVEYEYKLNVVSRRRKPKKTPDSESGLGTESQELEFAEDDDEKTSNDLNSTSDDLEEKKTI